MKQENKVYTFEDIKTHNVKTDMWVAVHGKVYDVTGFAITHPGGRKIIEEQAGTNATITFEDQGHDEYHIDKLERFLVGDYDDSLDEK